MNGYPFVLWHEACNGPAYRLRVKPAPYETLRSADAANVDGSPVRAYSPMACGTCGEPLQGQDLKSSNVRAAE